MSDAARASVNVNLNPNLLSSLAAQVGAPRSLTVHRVADLSRELHGAAPSTIEARVSQVLASLLAEANAEVMACRFRPQSNCLISLRLRDNPLGPAGTKAVAQALLSRAPLTLRVLSLAGVGAGDSGVATLTSALGATSAVHVMSLDLSDNGLTGAAGPALAALLAARSQALEELRLTRNPLGDAGVTALSNGLVANQGLRRLTLDRVGAGPRSIHALAASLRSHTTLSHLHIASNPLIHGPAGCAAIAELLTCARALERLCAGDSALGSGAAAALAAALEFESPRQLSASLNGRPLASPAVEHTPPSVGAAASPLSTTAPPAHVASLGGGIPHATPPRGNHQSSVALSYLWLERAQLLTSGAGGVVSLLTSPRIALAELWLGGNGLGDDAAYQLAAALPSATSLMRLHLERNEITNSGAHVSYPPPPPSSKARCE